MTFLKPPEDCTHISRRHYKSNLQLPCGFRTAVNTVTRGFRKINENSKRFARGKIKLVTDACYLVLI
jgi:hypothetical protein